MLSQEGEEEKRRMNLVSEKMPEHQANALIAFY